MEKSFDSKGDAQLPGVAERLLAIYPPPASIRNQIQDLLWEDLPLPEIPKRYRRQLAKSLSIEELCLNGRRFMELLDRLVLDVYEIASQFVLQPNGERTSRLVSDREHIIV